MNRRTLFKSLLAALAVPISWPWPKKSTPLRVTCNGDNYWSCVEVRDDDGKLKGHFEIRYDIKKRELFFTLRSEEDEQVSCTIDDHPTTVERIAVGVDGQEPSTMHHWSLYHPDGDYKIRMT